MVTQVIEPLCRWPSLIKNSQESYGPAMFTEVLCLNHYFICALIISVQKTNTKMQFTKKILYDIRNGHWENRSEELNNKAKLA